MRLTPASTTVVAPRRYGWRDRGFWPPLPLGEGQEGAGHSHIDNVLGEGGHHVLGKQAHGLFGQRRGEVANAVAGAEDVVAGALLLRLDLADHGVGAAHQGQTVVDPKIVGFGAFLKYATQ